MCNGDCYHNTNRAERWREIRADRAAQAHTSVDVHTLALVRAHVCT